MSVGTLLTNILSPEFDSKAEEVKTATNRVSNEVWRAGASPLEASHLANGWSEMAAHAKDGMVGGSCHGTAPALPAQAGSKQKA